MVASPVPMLKMEMSEEALLTLAPSPVTVQPLKTYPVAGVATTGKEVLSPTKMVLELKLFTVMVPPGCGWVMVKVCV